MLRIVTQVASVESFTQVFARHCDRAGLFIATQDPAEVGASDTFTVTLEQGEPVLSGKCEIIESYRDGANPHGLPGMKLRLDKLDRASHRLVGRMLSVRYAELAASRAKSQSGSDDSAE
ncbi:MAG: hypothetical protein AAGC55_24020, partial [Myxococcota bacterium]